VGKGGLEPPRLAAHDPKSCLSASSSTPPKLKQTKSVNKKQPEQHNLLTNFLSSRRQGLSPHTIAFYKMCLNRFLSNHALTPEGINSFLSSLKCNNGGKHAYYRAIRVFCNWLEKNDLLDYNPIKRVDPPRLSRAVLPSINTEQVEYLINYVKDLRYKAIISLLADSGLRLSELASITADDIDWDNLTIKIWGKGGKQRKAPFTRKTACLLTSVVNHNGHGQNIWHLKRKSIQCMLSELSRSTDISCNAHAFRRGFACNLHRNGLSTLDIMHLGGWSDLSMVLRYTQSITFEDCLKHYRQVE